MIDIFDKKNRGQGKLSALSETILTEMVDEFKLKSFVARVIGKNEKLEALLTKLGFKPVGCKESYIYTGGKYQDVYEYYLLVSKEK